MQKYPYVTKKVTVFSLAFAALIVVVMSLWILEGIYRFLGFCCFPIGVLGKTWFYGRSRDVWCSCFTSCYGFKEDAAVVVFPYTIYYPISDKINFILAHSIIKTTFGGIY